MNHILLVAVGGAVGAVARYGVSYVAARAFGLGFPWGTLIVNIIGGLLMGLLMAKIGPANENMRLLLGVGVLGGFTTFSAFSLETMRLMQTQAGMALLYVVASVVLSVGACWLGMQLVRP